ncbi:MAG: LacI family DNA-binding transcriptional regulator [Polyangiaceae bacterium]|nr:LacI family DNA-binding transcriptional regulator [Polyangiaceae bacterium]
MSTVSRVLNGGYASADAKRHVQLAVRELGYAPSVTARSLVTGHSGCIGVVAHSSQSPWFSQILAGVEEQLASSRESVLLGSLMLKGSYDSSPVASWIHEHRVDGLMFLRYTRRERGLLEAALRADLPVVLIAPDIAPAAAFIVRCDNINAGRLVGKHLASLGHRRVEFAGGPRDSTDTRDRLRGLRAELSERGVPMRDEDVWFGDYYPQSGIQYGELFLNRRPRARATAVVLGNDAMALGFMRTVLQRGMRIPQDVSVAGFDGVPDGALYWPGLTSVIQPTHLMGATACRALLDRIKDPGQDRVSVVQYGVELVIRQSTGAPATARPSGPGTQAGGDG